MSNKQIRYGIGFDVDSSSLNALKTELSNIQKMSVAEFKIHSNATGSTQELRNQLESIKNDAKKVEDALNSSFNPKLNSVNLDVFKEKLGGSFNELSKIEQSFQKLGDRGAKAFNNLTTSLLTTKREVKQTSQLMDSMINTLGNTLKWSIASGLINTFTSSIQKAWSYSVKLDKALNDIRIVTEKSAEDMNKFAISANRAAKSLGSATTEYAKASLIYYQQGLGEQDVKARTDVTIKAANVTGQSASEVSEQLTAVWNGYKVVAEDAEKYVDKLSAVAANTAADLEELSEGMSKVASGANAMGVDIDQLTAQLSTIVSVTRQDASSVGTALKTIFARMGDLKVDGVDEFGVSLGDVSGTLKKVGVEVLDQQGNLRDMGTIMEEVAGKWGTWTEAQQQAVAVAMAGKRQYNNLLALFENWDMYESALTTSQTSEGTLQKQQDIYMESTEAHLNQLSTAAERVYDAFFENDSMNDFLDVLTGITNTFGNFIEYIGGGGNLLLLFGGIGGKVLGKLIGGPIATLIANYQNILYNERQYRADLELTKTLGEKYSKTTEENQKKLIALKEQQLKLEKYINEEQRERNRENLEEVANAMNKQEEAVYSANDFDDQYRYMQGKKDTDKRFRKVINFKESGLVSDSEAFLTADENVHVSKNKLDTETENFNKADNIYKDYESKVNDNTSKLDNLKNRYADLELLRTEDSDILGGGLEGRVLAYTEQKKVAEEIAQLEKENENLLKGKNEAYENLLIATEKRNKAEDQYNEDLKYQNTLLENSVTMEEAVAHAKNIALESGDMANSTEEALNAQNYQSLNAQYSQQYGDISKDQISSKITELQNKKANAKSGSQESKDLEKQIKLLKELEKAEKKAVTSKTGYAKSAKDLQSKIKGLTTAEDSNNKITQEAKNKIIEIKKQYPQFEAQLKKVAEGQNLSEQEAREYTKALELLNAALKQSATNANAVAEAGEEQIRVIKETNEAEARAEAEAKAAQQEQAIQAKTQAITEMAGIAMQAIGTISSLWNVISQAAEDDSKTPAEKITSVCLALIPILLSVLTMIPSMISAFKTLGITMQGTGIQGLISGLMAQTGWGPFIAIVLIAMAALLAIAGIFALVSEIAKKMNDNGQEAFNKASEAAKQATERFNETKEAYEDLKNSLEDYNTAQKAIEEMTKGTEEWKNAIQDANMQVIDLIDKYPELAQYVSDVYGQLKISEEGQEAVLKSQKEEVNLANRGRMDANIEKAKAENSMIRQNGANKTMKTDQYAEDSAGAFFGTTAAATAIGALFGPIGAAVGLAVGAVAGAGIAAAVEEEGIKREEGYNALLKAFEENGQSIIADKEKFKEALAEQGVDINDEELVDALWENKEEIAKNSAEIQANNAAIKLQQQQITSSYLQDKSKTYQESKNQDAISKIITKNSNTESQEYKDQLEELTGSNGVDKDDAKNVFEQSGINGTFKEFKDGMITYVDENGDEKQVDADLLAKQVAQEKALAASGGEESVKKIETTLNTVAKNFGDNFGKAASKAVTGFVAGEKADLSTMTATEIANLDTAVDTIKEDGSNKDSVAKALGFKDFADMDTQAKALGYDNGEAYAKAIQTSVDNYKYEADNILTGLNNSVKAAYDKLDTKNWTLATQKAVAGSLESAFKENGTVAVDALQGLFADAADNLDEEDMQALANVAGKIDWSSSNALLEFNNQLEDLGINIPEDELGKFAQQMSGLVNVVNEVMTNLNGLRASFKELGDLTKDLKLGDTLSDEDYNNLIKYNKELANYFVMTADGYKYLGGGEEAFAKTKASQFDLGKAKTQFANAKNQGESLLALLDDTDKSNDLFDTTAVTDEQKAQSVKNLAGNPAYTDIIEASGYTQDQLVNAINKGSEKSTITGFENYTLDQLKDMKAEDLAKATGKSAEEAQKAISDATGQLKTSEELIKGAYSAINNNLTQIDEGTFDQNLENTATSYVSSMASNYDELQAYKDMLSEESYEKLAKVYLAQEAEQLGINAKAWEKIAESMPLDKQNTYLNNIQKIQNYDEVDYYKHLDDSIQDINDDLDRLNETQDKLYGNDLLENLQKQVELQKDLVDLENEKFEKQKEEWELRQQVLNDTHGEALKDFGIAGLTYDENGRVDSSSREKILSALNTKDISEEDREYLLGVLKEIDSYNDAVEQGIEDHAAAIRDAYQKQADLLIEKFNTSIQIRLDLDEAKREWEEFSNSMYKSGQGLKFFDEESASDTINNAINRSESLTSSFKTVIGAINDSNQAFESAQNAEQVIATYDEAVKTAETEYASKVAARESVQSSYEDALKTNNKNQEAYNTAVANRQAAETKVAESTAAYNEASKDWQEAYKEATRLHNEAEVGDDSYRVKNERAQSNKKSAEDKLNKAKSNDDTSDDKSAQAAYDDAVKKADDAQAAYVTAKAAAQSATANANALKEVETNARIQKEADEDALTSAKGAESSAKSALDTSSSALKTQETALETAKTNEENALTELNAAKQAKTDKVNALMASGNRYMSLDENGSVIANDGAYKEDMDNWMSEAQGYYESLQEEAQNVYDAYFTAQEEIMGMFDEQIEKLSSMNNILSSQAELMKLVGKNAKGSGAAVASLYTSMRENSEKNFILSKTQLEAAEQEYAKIMALGDQASEEQIATVTENLQTSTENMLSMASEYSTALADEYGAALTGIIDDYLKEITGMDLQGLTQDWELATQKDERYLDEVNANYAIDDLNRKFQKSIDETDSYTAQKKLNGVMQEQLKMLREKDKLSQYDIDRANAMYELTLKQIALEEAQNTANKMKLTRDASGNYSYQYVADQDAIAKAEEELAKAQNDLYNMDKERQKTLVDDYYSIMQEAQDKMNEAVAAGDTERLKKLQEHYFGAGGLLEGIKSEMSVASENFETIGTALGGADWVSPFKEFADSVTENTDFKKMVEDINKLTTGDSTSSGVVGQMTDAANTLNSLFTSADSPLVKATADLNTSISTGISGLGPKLEESMTASTNAINSLIGENGLLKNMETLGNNLKSLGEQYYTYLESKVDDGQVAALGANTAATQELTQTMLKYLDSLDNVDNNVSGYTRNEDGVYVQDAGTGD